MKSKEELKIDEAVSIIYNLKEALSHAARTVIDEHEISDWYYEVLINANNFLNNHRNVTCI